ncbi:hypothetical protein CC78DRAFT_581627 [Lojkania enalia]|uniref:Uncharacterized protein n=1 Tax=Lojkania enalia TaxID=147567 RepID=A0A9P4K936_9PLEO|nr:hypothetical protein CC78DRAFT_581627 [Didymosphaeria enalia]
MNVPYGSYQDLPPGTSVTLGASAKTKNLTNYPWAKSKKTMTDLCECYSIYDIYFANKEDVWSYEGFIHTAEKENTQMEHSAARDTLDTQPERAMQYAMVFVDPTLGPDPVILHIVILNGLLGTTKHLSQPFHDVDSSNTLREKGTYLNVLGFSEACDTSVSCNIKKDTPGAEVIRFPVDMKERL